MLDDNRQAWDMRADGSYVQRMPAENDEERGTHPRAHGGTAVELLFPRSVDCSNAAFCSGVSFSGIFTCTVTI